jgi:hypothetical protein
MPMLASRRGTSGFLRPLKDRHDLKRMGVCGVSCECGQVYISTPADPFKPGSRNTFVPVTLMSPAVTHSINLSHFILLHNSSILSSKLAKYHTTRGHIPEESDFHNPLRREIVSHKSFLFRNNILILRLNYVSNESACRRHIVLFSCNLIIRCRMPVWKCFLPGSGPRGRFYETCPHQITFRSAGTRAFAIHIYSQDFSYRVCAEITSNCNTQVCI